jgi:hypothetical protein
MQVSFRIADDALNQAETKNLVAIEDQSKALTKDGTGVMSTQRMILVDAAVPP